MTSLSNAVVLVTGGTGSFGRTMVQDLLGRDVGEVRIFSRDEEKQDTMRNELDEPRAKFYLGDVRNRDSVDYAMRGVDCVFHAAALKQVPSCEFFPLEAVRTNILGSHNVIHSAIELGVRRVVCLSTDKAVAPVNAMGMSKAMMEKVAQAAAREIGPDAPTIISSVRYGNVLFSRGSVVPLFSRQILDGRPITITERRMTRFLMPLSDSVALVRFALEHARQGDLLIRKAPACDLATLVAAMKALFGVPDHEERVIGWRHGERLFEVLASARELSNGEDLGEYWRLQMDTRSLNYQKYFTEGDLETADHEDFTSHNTTQMTVDQVVAVLRSLPEVQRDLAAFARVGRRVTDEGDPERRPCES